MHILDLFFMGLSFFNKTKKIFTVIVILPLLRIIHRFTGIFFRQHCQQIVFFHTESIFYDNSKYLFEYLLIEKNANVSIIVKNKALHSQLCKKYPGKVHYACSWKGFKIFRKAKINVISYGTSAMEFFPYYLDIKKQHIIYLGHGIPMKKIGRQVARWKHPFFGRLLQPYSFATCNSILEKYVLASSFHVDADNIWITGSPRNDKLFEYVGGKLKPAIPDYLAGKKIVLYAPTWREMGSETRFFPFPDFDAEALLHFLKQNNIIILLRGHKEEIKNTGNRFSNHLVMDHVIMTANQDKFPDVIEMLPFVDILITDYSGMYFDFLPFDKPMIFIPYDLKEYNRYKGLLFPYDDFTAGRKVFTQAAFIESLTEAINQPDKNKTKRDEMNRLFYRFTDTGACERIYQHILNIS